MKHGRAGGWWGPIVVYALSFVLLVVSAYLLFEGNTKSSLRFVWWSIAVSGSAAALAVASTLLPRR